MFNTCFTCFINLRLWPSCFGGKLLTMMFSMLSLSPTHLPTQPGQHAAIHQCSNAHTQHNTHNIKMLANKGTVLSNIKHYAGSHATLQTVSILPSCCPSSHKLELNTWCSKTSNIQTWVGRTQQSQAIAAHWQRSVPNQQGQHDALHQCSNTLTHNTMQTTWIITNMFMVAMQFYNVHNSCLWFVTLKNTN